MRFKLELGCLALLLCWPARAGVPAEQDPAAARAEALLRGMHVYERYCTSCHGVRGDGRGVSAPFMDPRPRDFTQGVYKFRSTPSGSLPTDDDLMRTIRRGVHNSNMPRWSALSDDQIRDVVTYIENFSPLFSSQPTPAPVTIPAEPPTTEAAIRRGHALYDSVGCGRCHGSLGEGDGPSSTTLVDDWGRPIKPPDLTRGQLKSGREAKDVYRVLVTGLNGTPMPSFDGSLEPAQLWDLTHYLLTLLPKAD